MTPELKQLRIDRFPEDRPHEKRSPRVRRLLLLGGAALFVAAAAEGTLGLGSKRAIKL